MSLALCFQNSSAQQKDLESKVSVVTVSYGAVACTCAQWIIKKSNGDQEYIFLEPANKNLTNSDGIWDGEHLPLQLKLTGRFYKQKGYPKNYHPTKGNPEPARVFKYDKIRILSPYFRNKRH